MNEIVTALHSELFSNPDLGQLTRMTVRLLFAAVLGGLLGYERKKKGKSAGIKTHMLVAIGSALFVIIPQQVGVNEADMTRVLQGLIAGIGFLGAGTIIKGQDDEEVKGLTTAAGIWMTAAIGVAAGLGREPAAVLGTILTLVILTVISRRIDPPAPPGVFVPGQSARPVS
jgi:putative Mg2+ transporter-C (MgtC) family protein